MNPLRSLCILACLMVAVLAKHDRDSTNMKPSQWLSPSELESIPSVDEVTLQRLESMSVEEGAKLMRKLYHLSQINHELEPTFVPSPSNIPVSIIKSNGENVTVNLNNLVSTLKQWPVFGQQEVTIFITGLPQTTYTVEKAINELAKAYKLRYAGQLPNLSRNKDYDYGNKGLSNSEEDYSETWKNPKPTSGNLIIINLGATFTTFKRIVMLDTEQTGAMIAKELVQLTNELDVPHEIIHIVAQGAAAHVAGEAARKYTQITGHKLRRITALAPSKLFAKKQNTLHGLARGDADFVDAIHTSAFGMGTPQRVGDVDFFPNGPSAGVPGADNVVEATMRATRYFAESVRPGNERNFPAVAAESLKQYKNKDGHGKRAYMGIATEFDVQGDFILQVNEKRPFGKRTPAVKQNTYHGVHQGWNSMQ